jgi:MtN3 and saliva related transmembrane protein
MNWIGFIAATCTTLSFLPQVIRTIRTKNTEGISLTMYIIFVFGVTMWLVYGILQNDWPLIIANFITLIFSGIILMMKVAHMNQGKR